jgi:hypothetical protein
VRTREAARRRLRCRPMLTFTSERMDRMETGLQCARNIDRTYDDCQVWIVDTPCTPRLRGRTPRSMVEVASTRWLVAATGVRADRSVQVTGDAAVSLPSGLGPAGPRRRLRSRRLAWVGTTRAGAPGLRRTPSSRPAVVAPSARWRGAGGCVAEPREPTRAECRDSGGRPTDQRPGRLRPGRRRRR